jgi:hypothetical protein
LEAGSIDPADTTSPRRVERVSDAVASGAPADCVTTGVAGDNSTGNCHAGRAADIIGRRRRAPTAIKQTT